MIYDTVIWDLDGTLLDTLIDLKNAVNFAMRTLGYPERPLSDIKVFVGNGVKKLIELAIPDGDKNPNYDKAYELFCVHYAAHNLDNTKPYPGILDVIEELRRRGVKQAIVSNKVDDAVKKLNNEFFKVDFAIGVTDYKIRKPAPDMVWKACDALEADRSKTVYIGDSEVDLKAASNANLPCISVLWGFRTREDLMPFSPATLVETPDQLLKFF